MITIKRIHVKNFRSIIDETIELSSFNCFVGKNDSGKSNVLKALNLFFNKKTDFNNEFDFNSDYSKFAKRGQKQAKEIVISLEIIVPGSFNESGIKIWKKVWRSEGLHSDNFSQLFKPKSKGFTLFDRIQYLYIPAVKSNEFFKDLLSKVYTSMTKTADSALKELNEKYSEQLQNLTKNLSEQIQNVLGMRSAIQMPSDLNTLFRDLSFSTSDKFVNDIDLNHRGDGIKARHIPSILRYMQENTENGRSKKSVGGSYIWGFEEPENGIEYLSCFEMAKEFYSYIKDCQILITTHSPAFYTQSMNAYSTRFLVNKNEEGASKYSIETGTEINETMGLMQLVAPFIERVEKEYTSRSNIEKSNLIGKIIDATHIMKKCGPKLDSNQVLDVIGQYAVALSMLDDYDHQRLQKPNGTKESYILSYDECKKVISDMPFSKENNIFGNEKDDSFQGSIGNIYQSFGGFDIYPSVEEKAANLLYFITKNHSFSDGNKRIAAAIFLHFLEKNNRLFYKGKKVIEDYTLVAITIMIAESLPKDKDNIVELIMNFLAHQC